MRLRFRGCLRAEFDKQPSATGRKQCKAFGIDAFLARARDENVVETFEADGFVLKDFGDAIGALVNVGISDDEQDAGRRTFDQTESRFKNGGASSFGADQGAGDVESVFGEKLIQVVAGDAAGDLRKALADLIAILVRTCSQFLLGRH